MKISGPRGPGQIPPPTEEPDQSAPSSGPSFRKVLEATPGERPEGPLQVAYAEIHSRLRAGEIDASRASELLVEAVVRSQLPGAAPRLQEQLRAALQKLLAEDPVLAAKLRELAEGSDR